MFFTRTLRDVGLATLITLVLYSSGFLVIFTPLPLLYVYAVRGRGLGAAVAVLSAVAVSALYVFGLTALKASADSGGVYLPVPGLAFAGIFSRQLILMIGIGYFAFFLAIALTLSEGAHRKWELARMGVAALLTGLVVFAAVAAAALLLGPADSAGSLKNYLINLISEVAKMNQSTGEAGVQAAFIADNAASIATFMMSVAPALIFVFALITVVVNILVGRRLIRGHHVFSHIHNVARFRLPDSLVWAVIFSGGCFFVDRYVWKSGLLETVAINGMISFGALYFLQGLAVTVYFLQGIRMPLLKMIAYLAIIFFFQTIGVVLVGVGLADVWADFRLRSWRARHGRAT